MQNDEERIQDFSKGTKRKSPNRLQWQSTSIGIGFGPSGGTPEAKQKLPCCTHFNVFLYKNSRFKRGRPLTG